MQMFSNPDVANFKKSNTEEVPKLSISSLLKGVIEDNFHTHRRRKGFEHEDPDAALMQRSNSRSHSR